MIQMLFAAAKRALIGDAAFMGKSDKSHLPQDATEMQMRQELAYFLHRLPDGVRSVVANISYGDKQHIFDLFVNDNSIERFTQFTEAAPNVATQTFKDDNGAEKFYKPSGICQIANAIVANKYQQKYI